MRSGCLGYAANQADRRIGSDEPLTPRDHHHCPHGQYLWPALNGQACRELNVACTVGALAVLLDTTMPLHYYSPYPQDPNQVANPILHQRITDLIGPDLHRWCIRGNWTGSFWASTDFPLADSQTELAAIGLSNQAVNTLSHKITPELAQAQDVYHSLLPYSTKLTLTP
jgi:hypothetical protein